MKLKGLQQSAENKSPRRKSKAKNDRDDDNGEDGDGLEAFNMRNES